MRAVPVLALWFAAMTAPHAAPVARPGVTPFEPGRDGIVLPVRLNGRGPFRLLLDTGSTHTAVSARTADAIGAPVVAKAVMGSVAGSRETLVVRVGTLEVGPVAVSDLLASLVELEAIDDDGIDGVIGQDALAALHYTIDFRQRHVVWWPEEGEEGCEGGKVRRCKVGSLELRPSYGRFVVALPQRESVLRLVPDSGASSLLLFDSDRLPVTPLEASALLTTTAAAVEVRLARVRELRVGGMTLRDVTAVVTGRDGSEPGDIDGLLPLHLFDRVTVDGPGQRMLVEKTRE